MKPLASLLLTACCLAAAAAEVIPPAPKLYFNDYASVVAPATGGRLNKQLEDFERDTSSQIVVAVFPRMESASSIEDYAQRLFRAWQIGQKQKNNGVLLAVFVQDRKLRIHVGYGLEGALPDALCKRIIDEEISPRFKARDFDGGLSAGVNAILAATKGEYKGTGRTMAEGRPSLMHRFIFNTLFPWHLWLLLVLLLALVAKIFRTHSIVYSSRQRRSRQWIDWRRAWSEAWHTSGDGSGDSGWSGGGDSGGGFSGGGGDSGGGGASGSW